jgi:hypothetical protein
MHHQGQDGHRQETEDASLWADRTSRKPLGAVQGSVRKVPFKDDPAIRDGKKKRLAEIKACMPPDGQPEIARAAKR